MTVDRALARERARWMLAISFISAGLGALLFAVAVRTESGQRFDAIALDGRLTRAAVLHLSVRLLDTISLASLALGSAVVLTIALARRRPHLALAAGVVLLGANASTQLLKRVILERPALGVPARLHELSNTFPSGHATVAMSLAVALVLVVDSSTRPWAALGGCVYAALIGISSVTAGKHRPSDIIAAYLVVTTWAGAAAAWLLWTRGAERARAGGPLERVPALSPFLVGTGVGVLLGALAAVAGAIGTARVAWYREIEPGAAYAAAVAMIAAAALVCLLAVLATIHDLSLDPPVTVRE